MVNKLKTRKNITLPIEDEDNLTRKTILHIDDEEIILSAMKGLLSTESYNTDDGSRENYRVISTTSPLAGMRLLGKYEPGLVGIILDLRMPDIDGFQFAYDLRKDSQIPIMVFSAYLDRESRDRCVHTGIDMYVKKPSRAEKILDAVRQCFNLETYQR